MSEASRSESPVSALGQAPIRLAVGRISATKAVLATDVGETDTPVADSDARERQVGGLVHALLRLFEARVVDVEQLEQVARQLPMRETGGGSGADQVVIARATQLYEELASRDEMRAMEGQKRLWEVPFSLHSSARDGTSTDAEAVVVRGTIDCLARDPQGRVTVFEFKTGRPRPEHQRQLDLYLAAARAMFPGAPVEGRLVYPQN